MPDTFTFEDKSKKMIRVVFEPDGTPLFCGSDLAIIAGYTSTKAALSKERIGVEYEKRRIWWSNSKKRGCANMICFTAENAKRFLQKKPVMNEAARWFIETVIPEAESIGRTKAAKSEMMKKSEAAKPETVERKNEHGAYRQGGNFAARLDAIILECALLKQELCRS